MDNPHTRAGFVCPLCGGNKPEHLVACWLCYSEHSLKYGNPHADARIADFENALAGAARRTADRRLQPAKPQAACDFGLFGDGHRQLDLIDQARAIARKA